MERVLTIVELELEIKKCIKENNISGAIDVCNRAIKVQPLNFNFYEKRANLYFSAGEYTKALIDCQIAKRMIMNQKSKDSSTIITTDKLTENNAKCEIEFLLNNNVIFSHLDDENSDLEKIYTDKINKYLDNFEYDEVIASASYAISSGIYNDSIFLAVAIVHALRKCYEDAYNNFAKAVICNPDNLDIYYHRSAVSLKKKQPDLDFALTDLTEIINRDISQVIAYYNRAYVLHELGRYAESADDCRRAIYLDENCIEAYCSLAKSHYALASYYQAIAAGEVAISLGKKNCIEVYCIIAKAYYELKDYAKSLEYSKKAIDIEPKNIEAYTCASMAAYYLGDYLLVIELSNKLLTLNPSFGPAFNLRASAYMSFGKIDEANKDLAKACQLMPECTKVILQLFIHAKINYRDYIKKIILTEPQTNYLPEDIITLKKRVDEFDTCLKVINKIIQLTDRKDYEYLLFSFSIAELYAKCRFTYIQKFANSPVSVLDKDLIRIDKSARYYIISLDVLLTTCFSSMPSDLALKEISARHLDKPCKLNLSNNVQAENFPHQINTQTSSPLSFESIRTKMLVEIIMGISQLYNQSDFASTFFNQKLQQDFKDKLQSCLIKSVLFITTAKEADKLREFLNANRNNIYSLFNITILSIVHPNPVEYPKC